MTYFDHAIKYPPLYEYAGTLPQYKGANIRTAVICYKNIFDEQRVFQFRAPSNLWNTVRVGGTMSTGGECVVGMVTRSSKPLHQVTSNQGRVECFALPSTNQVPLGTPVVVFDYMDHAIPGAYGSFRKAMVANLDLADQLNLHSINIILLNGQDHVGVIHLDPFIDTANYDDLTLTLPNGRKWSPTDLANND